MFAVILTGLVFAFGFPIRSYLDQRHQIKTAEHHLAVLRTQNEQLQHEAQRLSSDAEVERLARSLYNLVKPGEEAYAIVPTPVASSQPTTTPSRIAAPAGKRHHEAAAWYRRMWHSIAGIL
jgi:hypothetical protein